MDFIKSSPKKHILKLYWAELLFVFTVAKSISKSLSSQFNTVGAHDIWGIFGISEVQAYYRDIIFKYMWRQA